MQSSDPWCVKWRDRESGKVGWCLTHRNARPDDGAVQDKTACGYYVSFRTGEKQGYPTCALCLAILDRRERKRATHQNEGTDHG